MTTDIQVIYYLQLFYEDRRKRMQTATLVKRLQAIDSASVADVMTAMGLDAQVLAPSLKPLSAEKCSFAGVAVCARGAEAPKGETLPTFALDDAVHEDSIVVIETGGCELGAIIGDNMATSMIRSGAKAFVIDGGVRDADALRGGETPVYCRYASSVSAHRFWKYTSVGEAITMPGIWSDVRIEPGDLMRGDADGIAIVPKAHAETIIEHAERLQQVDEDIKAAMLAGKSREEATRGSDRLKGVKPLTTTAQAPSE
jgi:regulator of RNase E activity RraA